MSLHHIHPSTDQQETFLVVYCIDFSEQFSLPLINMLKFGQFSPKSRSNNHDELPLSKWSCNFYCKSSGDTQLKTHPNYELKSSGDWTMDVYKCSIRNMSPFYFCRQYFGDQYYDTQLERIASISLMEMMNVMGIDFVRNIRRKGDGEIVERHFNCDVKFKTFDGLPKYFVRAVIVKDDGIVKRLICESEGVIYVFEHCSLDRWEIRKERIYGNGRYSNF